MGLVVCGKHGNGFMFVCPHVRDAILEDGPCDGIQQLCHSINDLPELENCCWYCPHCIAEYRIPPSGIVTDEEAFSVPSEVHRPMCPGCFDEWLTRQRPQRLQSWRGLDGGG